MNVSARQFSDPGFVDLVREALRESGLEPGALMLELTESVLLRRDERVHDDLRELKDIGVRLAIDDFGTGYSSLSYLRELPIDVLKVDKSFVDGIAVSGQRLALAEGIVQLARTLRLEVIAEGIESEVQRDLLTSMGCQFGQGYVLAMPMPASEAETLARIESHLVPSLPHQVPEARPSALHRTRAGLRQHGEQAARHSLHPGRPPRLAWMTRYGSWTGAEGTVAPQRASTLPHRQ